jgi:diaminopimelate decarboxylase
MTLSGAFCYRNEQLFAENIPVQEIVNTWGTPCYIYSKAALKKRWEAFKNPLENYPSQICYAVKANSNLSILGYLASLGAGFDIVSIGELERVLAAKGQPDKIIFSGVGKREVEIIRALEVGIACLNVESISELERIQQIAKKMQIQAPVAIRINPNIHASTHPYITTGLKENKFGINIEDAIEIFLIASRMSHIHIKGVTCHIGSQLLKIEPFLEALNALLTLIDELTQHEIHIEQVDIGGGLGVRYQDESPLEPEFYVNAIISALKLRKFKLILEPGRALVADMGILVTRVEYLKHTSDKNFAIVDAGMNDLLRPALYGAWQNMVPVKINHRAKACTYDVVGPICETSDFLGKNRLLSIEPNDYLAITQAGAYGFVMSSHYNTRPCAPEILVEGDQFHLIRRRETIEDLLAAELDLIGKI